MTSASKIVPPYWLRFVVSIWMWFYLVIGTAVISLTTVFFILPFSMLIEPRERRFVHIMAQWWGRYLVRMNPFWSVEVKGIENIDRRAAYVIVANHQSIVDIFLLLAVLPLHFKFVAKKELFSIPFVGWHMTLAKYMPLDRGSHESGRRVLIKSKEWLEKGVSILLFPEGTRSLDGNIHEFKAGAFKLARETGRPLLPVVVNGTGNTIPKKSWMLDQRCRLIVSIGCPIPADDEVENLRHEVRLEMAGRLKQIRAAGPAL